ncbi:MAG TPA: TonB-dependent receptor [Gemmatimonadaceae bacterium]
MRRIFRSHFGLRAPLALGLALVFCVLVLAAIAAPATPLRAQALLGDGAGGMSESAPRFLANLPASSAWAPLDPARTPILRRRIALELRGATVASALDAITSATGLHFAYSSAEVPVNRTVKLEAKNITVAAALTEVLLGTSVDVVLTKAGQAMLVKRGQLRATETGTIRGTVTEAGTGAPLQGASVALLGARIGAVVKSDGSYEFTAPPGHYTIRARLLGYQMRDDSIAVTDGQTVQHDFTLQRSVASLNAVVVTGTRQPDRTALDAPAPVDVFTSEQIRQSGRTETSQILELLAPSFNFPRATVTDGTDHIRPATLRGLNSDQVLVLINGKRRHNSALVNINGSVGRGSMAVDLNAIPPSSIDHIEILRDGAAAQYGSDAIAGVINIILKSDAPGELSGQVGQTARSDGRTSTVDANYSFALPRDGYLSLAGEFRTRDSTNRSGPDSRTQYLDGDPRNDVPQLNNRTDSWVGDPKSNGGSGMFNLGIPFSGGVQLYAFGGFSYEHGIAAGFFRRPLDDRTIRAIYPNGFLPLIESHIWDLSEATGVKGTLGGWNWDLGSVFGRNSFRYNVDQSANVSMGLDTPTRFYAGTMTFDQWSTTLDVQRGFDIGWSQPLSVAWGAEFRRDHYGIQAGDDASWMNGGVPILDGPNAGNAAATGAQVFPGFRPNDEQDASRSNVAAYVDIAGNPTEQLLVDVAGRAEHYSDFGNTVTGKISAHYEPVKGYAIRGSLSNGFRAPSLGQEYFSTTSTNFIAVNGVATPFDIRTFPVTSAEAKALGAKPLKAEKSMNYGIGVALQPVSNLSFTADYYRIDIRHRIVLSGNFIGADIQQLLENAGFQGVTGGRFFTNAIDTRTEGVDLVLQTGANLGNAGTLRFTGGYNHNYTHVTKIDDTPPELSAHQQVLFDRTQVGLTEVAQPHDNLRLSADYEVKGVGVVLSEARYGSVTNVATTPANDQTYGAKWITDLSLAYHFSNGLTVTGGADNIFNVFPDKTIAANSSGGIFVYSGFSPFGYNGAFYFLRLSVGL